MAKLAIDSTGCRGCSLCVDVCPVEVFAFDQQRQLARVETPENCISCLSCAYLCPSQCLTVEDYVQCLPLHRIEENVDLVEKFLQEKPEAAAVSAADCEVALKDVSMRLEAFAQAVMDTLGRAYGVVGRKAGALAAAHMPEAYEDNDLAKVLAALQRRFAHSFEFDFKVDGNQVQLDFHPCCLSKIVTASGQKPGEAGLCLLFHDYWNGLLGAFANKRCQCKVPVVGERCEMRVTLAD